MQITLNKWYRHTQTNKGKLVKLLECVSVVDNYYVFTALAQTGEVYEVSEEHLEEIKSWRPGDWVNVGGNIIQLMQEVAVSEPWNRVFCIHEGNPNNCDCPDPEVIKPAECNDIKQ